jgi:acetyl esterase/lipase
VTDVPTLTPFWPSDASKATGAVMIICPGGGYGMLAAYEGKDYALFLADHGVTCFVLKYRLGSNGYHHPAVINDLQRAVRTVRANAPAWQIDAHRIGVMGSSAGGHLASTALTHFDSGNPDAGDPIDRADCRPDLGVLCYPVISMAEGTTHAGSRQNLLGEHPDAATVKFLSSELQVTPQTPPCFLFHTFEDKLVKIEGVLAFASALQQNSVPFDLHVYQKGGHGLGLGLKDYNVSNKAMLHPWTSDLLYWLRVQDYCSVP